MVSAYSWPSTMVTPSRVPAEPALTKFWPQEVPASVTYGMFVNAMSPTEELAPTSPFQSCQAQKPALGKPSGRTLCAERITYWELRLLAAVVLPKWLAAVTAVCPSCSAVGADGEADPVSAHTPARAPPVG